MPLSKQKLNLQIDLRFVSLALLLVIIGMLAVWRPWSSTTSTSRTISVTGEATITAEPDEYVFMPSYEFKDTNKTTALAALSAKSETVVKALKEIGVVSSKIKTSSDGYNYPEYYLDKDSGKYTYTLRLTVTLDDKKMVQKVQDYLVTTAPVGQVSPQTDFSEATKKALQDKARDAATKDARQKAEKSATNLGFKLAKVKSIEDMTTFGSIVPVMSGMSTVQDSASSSTSLTVQPGENELNYSVNVVYFIR